jgi:hypothetical protein
VQVIACLDDLGVFEQIANVCLHGGILHRSVASWNSVLCSANIACRRCYTICAGAVADADGPACA